jgi:hypothetical protein
MTKNYLFRIDGAKDNDAFFNALRPSMSHVYAGVDIQIGSSGWSPDFIRISVGESQDSKLTLIELDATESIVRISCRKYLPENSTDIVRAFGKYLERVIAQCQTTAHPHENEFIQLKAMLSKAEKIVVTTAGGLRSAVDFIEELSLLDQPERILQMQSIEAVSQITPRIVIPNFNDKILRLSPLEAKILSRPVLILDAVIRKDDHSAAAFNAWRQSQLRHRPYFKKLKQDTAYPSLRSLLFETVNRGIALDFEALLSELAEMWSGATKLEFDQKRVRDLISGYFPIASEIKREEESMRSIFEKARRFVAAQTF